MPRGWLEHISVRRPWRRRGLASALIARSLRVLRERGFEEAALGVDAENLVGGAAGLRVDGLPPPPDRRRRTGRTFTVD